MITNKQITLLKHNKSYAQVYYAIADSLIRYQAWDTEQNCDNETFWPSRDKKHMQRETNKVFNSIRNDILGAAYKLNTQAQYRTDKIPAYKGRIVGMLKQNTVDIERKAKEAKRLEQRYVSVMVDGVEVGKVPIPNPTSVIHDMIIKMNIKPSIVVLRYPPVT